MRGVAFRRLFCTPACPHPHGALPLRASLGPFVQVSIGLQGARHLAAMLKENSTLTRLVVSGNDKFGIRGLEEVCGALADNKALVSLGFAGTNCGDPGADIVLELLEKNPTLTDVCVA